VKKLPAPILKKLHPKLRMIANGNSEVNALRAERCAGITVSTEKLLRAVPELRTADDTGVAISTLK